MMHTKRVWGVVPAEDPQDLATKLTEMSWTLCSAFETAAGTIWVNDSTNPDALQEYGVLRSRPGPDGSQVWQQVESITVTWCSQEKLRSYIEEADTGLYDEEDYGTVTERQLDRDHRPCPHCR